MEKNRESVIETDSMENQSLRQVAQLWLASKKEHIAATTYTRYLDALERNIYPKYGDTPVSEITDEEIRGFAKTIAEKARQEGKSVTFSTLEMTSGVLALAVDFARGQGKQDAIADMASDKREYTCLETEEIERICRCARHNRTPEMLAVMLALFCGLRSGEICALDWEDVSLEKMQIHVHCSAHRVRAVDNPNKKTEIRVEEISTKKQRRTVTIPEEMKEYIEDFYAAGKSVLSGRPHTPADVRTLINRIERTFEVYKIKKVNFQRLRKTYVSGKADIQIFREIFGSSKSAKQYMGSQYAGTQYTVKQYMGSQFAAGQYTGSQSQETPDKGWLIVEMARDLASLRMLVGFSTEEMGELLGISENAYRDIEEGIRALSWVEYLNLLFLFHYNKRTGAVVDALGLYPDSLKEKLGI